eukprot:m.19641 g.19641  ORF g.19641 m.19641 type:complete len:456 (-) comp5976_c0_seq1:137-1504(-)
MTQCSHVSDCFFVSGLCSFGRTHAHTRSRLPNSVTMTVHVEDATARRELEGLARAHGLDVFGEGARLRRTSSRFCLTVEHGDYNGTELFGVGTDRFIWVAYKPNDSGRARIVSHNFPADGLIEFDLGKVPAPLSSSISESWARFPYGVDYVLRKEGFPVEQGYDAVVYGNIPGGGMSRSASLSVNLVLCMLDLNNHPLATSTDCKEQFRIVELSQQVENEYIGSPCGQLDQIMILFARAGQGTHYRPADRSIEYVELGAGATDFAIVSLDTGTLRPGLEKSTYRVRRAECDEVVALTGASCGIKALADIKTEETLGKVVAALPSDRPGLAKRAQYIFEAQQRFSEMLAAWRAGDIESVGRIFRLDGIGLRDLYEISGPELESMVDIARTVPGVLGERMLGGGDKGASGAIVRSDAVEDLQKAVDTGYPRSHPDFARDYALHVCRVVDGVAMLDPM